MRIALYTTRDKTLASQANLCCSRYGDVWPGEAWESSSHPADVLISFLSDRILPGHVVRAQPSVNFHPAPPEYPGRGGASYALYDGAESYGATAHEMVERVDAGLILDVVRFPIVRGMGCAELYSEASWACLPMLDRILWHMVAYRRLPPPNGAQWGGPAKTRKQFQGWLELGVEDSPQEFERKILAARHPTFPGPYVNIHGHRFGYVGEDSRNA